MKQNKTYLHLGVTLIVSACAVLMFYDTFFQSRVLLDFFDKLMSVLSPVIYGLVFAYLLAPIVDFFDRYIQKGAAEGQVLARPGAEHPRHVDLRHRPHLPDVQHPHPRAGRQHEDTGRQL